MESTLRLALAGLLGLAVIAPLAVGPVTAPADEVTIRVIGQEPAEPGQAAKPAGTDAPKPGEAPVPAEPAKPAALPSCGDYVLDRALADLGLTPEQAEKIRPFLDAAGKEHQAGREGQGDEYARISRELMEAYKLAAQRGGNPTTQPEVEQAQARMKEAQQKRMDQVQARREQLVAQISAFLTAEQIRLMQELIEEWSNTPAGFARRMARYTIGQAAPGVALTEPQRQQVMGALQERFEQSRKRQEEARVALTELYQRMRTEGNTPETRQAMEEIQGRQMAAYRSDAEADRKIVDSVLTEEQRAQVAQARLKSSQQWARQMADWTLRTIQQTQKVELTEPQRQRAQELADATARSMADLGPADWEARTELTRKLRDSIEQEVLTAEQLAAATEARREQANRWTFASIDGTTRLLEGVRLSEDQRQKLVQLTAAAREAAGRLDPDDMRSRGGLTQKFRADAMELLTDEQKKQAGRAWVYPNASGGQGQQTGESQTQP